MTAPRGGLGRGLGALIPSAPVGTAQVPAGQEAVSAIVAGARFAEVLVDQISPNPSQPRTNFDDEAMAELVVSIRAVGLLQPVVVREKAHDRYELVMGERRWRASREAGLLRIPAIIRDTGDDVMLRDALLENLHREQLNPLEEAAAYQQLLAEFGATHEELASRIGRSRPQISNTIRLLQLPAAVQRRLAAGVLSAGHARAILGLDSPAAQEEMAGRVVAEGLSVRGVEEAVTVFRSGPATGVGRRPPQARSVAPDLLELSERLSDRFETRVRVEMGRAKGKLTIEFGSREDLDRIVAIMDSAG